MNVQQNPFPRRFSQRRGFSLIALAIAMFVFSLILILVGTILPVEARAPHAGGSYAQAVWLAQHKIDQLRNAGAAKLERDSLAGLGLIDTNTNGTPKVNSDGSYSFTLMDNLVNNTKTACSSQATFRRAVPARC